MRAIAIGMVCLGLAGCDSPNFRTSQLQFGTSEILAATGNLRFVSERTRPFADGTAQIVTCSEPSPDYATAFSQDVDVSVKSTSTQAPFDATLGNNVTEKIEKLPAFDPTGTMESLTFADALYWDKNNDAWTKQWDRIAKGA